MGPSLGSRVTRTATRSARSQSANLATWVVVPEPSIPSSTTNRPRWATVTRLAHRLERDNRRVRRCFVRSLVLAQNHVVDEPGLLHVASDGDECPLGDAGVVAVGLEPVGVSDLDVIDPACDRLHFRAGGPSQDPRRALALLEGPHRSSEAAREAAGAHPL